MKNVLAVSSALLVDELKRASIGKGKDSGYTLAITEKQVQGQQCCTLICGNGTMQANSVFYAQFARLDDDNHPVKEALDKNIYITVDSIFRQVIETMAETDPKLLLIYEGNQLIAQNERSRVPILIVEGSIGIENPKDHKCIEISVEKKDIEKALKYVNVALSKSSLSKYGNMIGFMPQVKAEKGILHIFACDETTASYQEIELVSMGEDFVEKCKEINYAMIAADKISQIVAMASVEMIRFVFYYHEDQLTPKQVNIFCGNDMYQILTCATNLYSKSFKALMDQAYEKYDIAITADVKELKNAMQISALGTEDVSRTKTIFYMTEKEVLISDQHEEKSTKLKNLKIQLDPQKKFVRFTIAYDLMIALLRPLSGKITIKGCHEDTPQMITFQDKEDQLHMILIPIISNGNWNKNGVKKQEEDTDGEE